MEYITDFGLESKEGKKPIQSEVELCERWINEFVTMRKTINTERGSYGLKHAAEHWLNEYVSNGAFIQAAVNLGYKYKRDGPNAYFNMAFPKYSSAQFREAFERKPDSPIGTNHSAEREKRMIENRA